MMNRESEDRGISVSVTSAAGDAAGGCAAAGDGAHAATADALTPSEKRTYDRVRSKVMEAVSGKVPPRLRKAAEICLTLPDFVALIFRLMKDPRVPAKAKVKLGLFTAYLVSPVDLVPDFIPVLGQVDDLVAAVIVIRDLLSTAPREVVLEHWSGQKDIIGLIETVLDVASEVLGRNVLKRLLRRFGRKT